MTITELAQARKDGAWARDVPRGCPCPHVWNPATQRWERRDGASCQVHR